MKKSIIFILLILFSVTSVFSYEFDGNVYQAQKLFKSLGYNIDKIDGMPSRNILTSGGLEPVADEGKDGHSIFAYYFIKKLQENPWPYLSVKQLGYQVEKLVTRNSDQKPVSKFLHGVGDEDGQFFFINKFSQGYVPPPIESEKIPLPGPQKSDSYIDDLLRQSKEKEKAMAMWSNWQRGINQKFM